MQQTEKEGGTEKKEETESQAYELYPGFLRAVRCGVVAQNVHM